MPGETCDDGDLIDTNKCKGDCSGNALGWICSGGTPITASTCVEVCGNGIKTLTEGCDDLNLANNDGCSSVCQVESGYTCSG